MSDKKIRGAASWENRDLRDIFIGIVLFIVAIVVIVFIGIALWGGLRHAFGH